MNNTLFLIVLIFNALLLGGVIAFAVYHAREHFSGKSKKESKKTYLPVLPHETRQRILEEAEEEYHLVLERTAKDLERSLAATTNKLNGELGRLGGTIVSDEMEAYKEDIEHMREEVASSVSKAETEISRQQTLVKQKLNERQEAMERQLTEHESQLSALLKARESRLAEHQARLDADLLEHQRAHEAKRAELEAKLEQEINDKRALYEKQLDEKLSEALASFLSETLGHEIDLGAQKQYLLSSLKAHKNEIKESMK